MKSFFCCFAMILLNQAALAESKDYGTRYTGDHFATRSPVLARNGMASTSHPIASAIAVDILKRGGSAIDAAIAANAMLALVEPYACGIGGDLFAIVWDPVKRELVGYNGSGRTAANFDYGQLQEQLGERDEIPLFGGLSISVPGAVDGWFALHQRFGKLPMAELLAPAIEYARQGVAITEVDAATWGEALGEFTTEYLTADALAELQRVYTRNSKAPAAGELFHNPDLAASYERLVATGRDGYYSGETGQAIVSALDRLISNIAHTSSTGSS